MRLSTTPRSCTTFWTRCPSSSSGRLDDLRARCHRLAEHVPSSLNDPRLGAAFTRIRERLTEMQAALSSASPRAALLARHAELSRAYEQWAAAVRAAAKSFGAKSTVRIGSLRPLIGARSIFHILTGLTGVVLYQWVLTRWQATATLLVMLGICVTLEVTRRLMSRWNHFLLTNSVFRPIARPGEYWKVNSSTYYLVALSIVTPLFPKPAVIVGVLILALADPAAAWVGKRYGRIKLHGPKSVLGSLTFVAVGIALALAYFALLPDLTLARAVPVAIVTAMAGALAELFSGRLDDNLTIPVVSVLSATIMLP